MHKTSISCQLINNLFTESKKYFEINRFLLLFAKECSEKTVNVVFKLSRYFPLISRISEIDVLFKELSHLISSLFLSIL